MITIVGAGPAGCLMAILLARRGVPVEVFERRSDPRIAPPEAGRSINLALASRGIRALREGGVAESLEDLLVMMRGRMLHEPGEDDLLIPYGQRENEVIHSISRARLTARLVEAAGALPNVALHFDHTCTGYQGNGVLHFRNASGTISEHRATRIIAADGAGSVLRQSLAARGGFTVRESRLDHDYKELVIPAAEDGPRLAMNALHIWPRGGFMLIALPNADGSFTATLFLAREGEPSFRQIDTPGRIRAFFQREFPQVVTLIPDLVEQFAANPQGLLGTVHCPVWRDDEQLLLIGDAAHAIVPFHGQGMNCAFEDCRVLNGLLIDDDATAFARFETARRADCEAIAAMALENYEEMRDTVLDPRFQRQKAVSMQLERLFPGRFIPRYSMVMFHDEIPYSIAQSRGRIQQGILDELVPPGSADGPIDMTRATTLIDERLPALAAGVQGSRSALISGGCARDG